MQTYPIKDDTGTTFALEIENAYVRPRRLTELLRRVDGVSSLCLRRPFTGAGDVRATFQYRGRPFVILEPFGDNSRYWVGPEDQAAEKLDISAIEEVLRYYRLSAVERLIGALLTLRWS